MGSYTPTFKMYQPDQSEIVDVDGHLNDNWKILDINVNRLMEYRYTNVTSVGDSFSTTMRPMHRWYKTWSNSLIFESFSGGLDQDPYAKIEGWTSAKPLLKTGWKIKQGNGLYYRENIKSGNVEWTGAIQLSTEAVIPAYTMIADVIALPDNITPKMSRYFVQNAGNTDTGYSEARLIFNRLGRVDIIRYGDAPSSTAQNKIDFGGIRYDKRLVGS